MGLSPELKLQAILYGTGAGTWEWNPDTGDVILDERWAQQLGYTLEDLQPVTSRTWHDLCHPDDRDIARTGLVSCLKGQADRFECVVRMRHKDGSWRYVHSRARLMGSADSPEGRWMFGTHLDVTDAKETEHQLIQLSASLPGIIYSFIMEPDGRYYFGYVSQKTVEFYGFPPSAVQADPDLVFNTIHRDDLARVQASIETSRVDLTEWSCDYRVVTADGMHWMRGIAKPERSPEGTVTWHGMVINIDEQKRLEQRLEHLSVTDELTGLYNRRHMLARLDEMTSESARYGGNYALASIDIDFFKSINDSHGHPTGDRVLRQIADLLKSRIRRTDLLARTGGEEFFILMPHTLTEDAVQVVNDLRERMEKETFRSDTGDVFDVTLSAGVIGWQGLAPTTRRLLAAADKTLYRAKREGRNRVLLADQSALFPEKK
ncbi:sensor domain-containing diguanylate cyclase [Marinobacter sp. C2H3]|uniref:sensor domain-containing diguanylate cyclase n=1 Tax=Marinobacter sp. C2H3 TaxID=3119003 RepID=UPI00300F0CE4